MKEQSKFINDVVELVYSKTEVTADKGNVCFNINIIYVCVLFKNLSSLHFKANRFKSIFLTPDKVTKSIDIYNLVNVLPSCSLTLS